jgi:hypothetical protein
MIRRSIALAAAFLLTLAAAPAALADEHGTNRPITGTMTGVMNFVPGDASCPVYTVPDGGGTVGHLGRVWSHWSHCMPTHADGHVVMTAANGDQLFGEYTVPQIPFWVTITGGTGRFADASGGFLWSVRFWGPVDLTTGMPINPWHFEGRLEGTISY